MRIPRIRQIATNVVLSNALTTYSCAAQDLRTIAPDTTPTLFAIGSSAVSSGTFSGVLYGGMSAAGVAVSTSRIACATPFTSVGEAAAGAKLKNAFDAHAAPSVLPWMQLILSRATGAGTSITVNVWMVWMEEEGIASIED